MAKDAIGKETHAKLIPAIRKSSVIRFTVHHILGKHQRRTYLKVLLNVNFFNFFLKKKKKNDIETRFIEMQINKFLAGIEGARRNYKKMI